MKHLAPLALLCTLLSTSEAQAYTFLQRMGCPGDMGAAWPSHLLPSTWHMHEGGYSKLRTTDLVEATRRSVDAWGQAWETPCCSGFTNHFAGFTQKTGLDDSDLNVVSVEEANWPRWLGSQFSVIAVTLPGIERASCSITSADMVFNAVTFQYRIDGRFTNSWDVDFESIAVHEFGHWIGLDHSQNRSHRSGFEPESVMFPSYRGGIGDRELYRDDMLAACALYPAGCGTCTADRQCPEGMACEGGSCVQVDCKETADCPLGSVCAEGSCWRGCRSHFECELDQLCKGGSCTDRRDCTTCRSCRRAEDCGPSGDYLCTDLDGSGSARCSKFCRSDVDCDGDSICWEIPNSEVGVCAGPAGGESICPAGYRCEDSPCASLGDTCIRDGCGMDADTCVATESGAVCSCTCRSNSDCGADGRCLPNPATGVYSCFPLEGLEPCGTSYCPSGASCYDGRCLAPCGEKICAEDEVCRGGTCVSACPSCGPGEVCDEASKSCVTETACLDVDCTGGLTCVDGACKRVCGDTVCGDGQICKSGRCADKDKGSSSCSTSAGGASTLGLAALALALLRGRRNGANHRV